MNPTNPQPAPSLSQQAAREIDREFSEASVQRIAAIIYRLVEEPLLKKIAALEQ